MKNKLYRTWWIISSFSLCLGYGVYSYGCADGWWDYYQGSVLTPEAFADESYKPLFYAPYDKFYGFSPMYNNQMFTGSMLGDWQEYLKGLIPEEDIDKCLLFEPTTQHSYSEFIDELTPEIHARWSYTNDRVVNFLVFLKLAKQIELYSSQVYDYWDYDTFQRVDLANDQAQDIAKYYLANIADSNKDTFFKNRMWFQVIKAYFYSDKRFDVVSFFEATKDTQAKNELYYRALSYVAGAYYQEGDYLESDLLFAQVFDKSPALRQLALYNFKVLPKKDIIKMQNKTDDKSVQSALWALYGYYSVGQTIEAMQNIYAIDPSNAHLDFLLTRWVNQQEIELIGLDQDNFKNKKEYLEKVNSILGPKQSKWVEQVASNPSSLHNPALWSIVSGYLNILQGNNQKASEFLQKASKLQIQNPLVENQIRLLSLINQIEQLQYIDNQGPLDLLQDIDWLLNELDKDAMVRESEFRYEHSKSWVRKVISGLYKKQGDILFSELANPSQEFYSSVENTQLVEDFLAKGNFNTWQSILLKKYPVELSEIYQNKAILLFYQDQLQQSLAYMKKAKSVIKHDYFNEQYIQDYKDFELLGNPFNGKIQDCNDCDHDAVQITKYTKETFIEKILEMQNNIDQGNDVFNNALLVGNAFYNASYYGNARMFYHSELFQYNGNSVKEANRKYLLNMDLVNKYYTLAKEHATTKEQKAKIAYLQAKLQRNDFFSNNYFNQEYFYGAYNSDVVIQPWQGFKELHQLYSDTQYYQQVINECGYFRTFVSKQDAF